MKETHKSSIGKIFVILLSSVFILSATFIVPTKVQAATFDNSVSDFKLHTSGCLKSMQISIRGIDTYSYAPAYGKIAIHSQESKYTWTGTHLNIGSPGNWPESIPDDGFVVWGSGEEFLWTDKETHVVTVDFPDQIVDLNDQQTYYVYLWTRNGTQIYTDALVYTFKTKDGALTDSNGNELITTHTHNWNYRASKNELKSWCNGGTGACDYLGEANALTLTLNTTETMDYTGGQYSGASISSIQKTAWTNAGLTVPEIKYAGTGSTNYISSAIAPHEIGSYKATITAGGATAESPFTILEKLTTNASFAADSDDSGTLSNVTPEMKYSVDGGIYWDSVTGTTMHLTGISADKDIKVYQPGNGTTTSDSDIQTIDITQAAKPANVSSVNCTTANQNDGKLINLDSTMEYKKSTDGIYTSIASETITGLSNGSYYVRIKATGTTLASPAQTVTILEHTCATQGSWLSDETNHWNTCQCGEILNKDRHTYKWIIDEEATKGKNGLKHQQCTVCGYKKAAVAIPATITPTTGDTSHILLWISITIISICSSIAIFFKKSSCR